MSKKKHHDHSATDAAATLGEQSLPPAATETAADLAVPPISVNGDAVAPTADPLQAEVQSFLAQREQLAQRLAGEIAATERRLAELKRTAAALFPTPERPPEPSKKSKRPRTARAASAPPSDAPSDA